MSFYSGKAKQFITNIFAKHNVKLEFENPKDISNALEEVINTSVKVHIAQTKKSLSSVEMKEYDVFTREYLSNIKGYTYAWLSILADEKVANQIKLIRQAYYYFDGLLDLSSLWAISFIKNTNSIEGYYYTFSDKNLLGKNDEFVETVYDSMSLSEKNKTFLRSLRLANPNKFNVHYLAFDSNSVPRKIGFKSTIAHLLESNVEEVYDKYVHIHEIIDCLKKSSNHETELGFQFIPERNYFGIDINVANEDVIKAIDAMKNVQIIGEQEAAYMKTLFMQGMDNNISNVTWKYRWTNSKKFTIKQYNYYDNEKHPKFV